MEMEQRREGGWHSVSDLTSVYRESTLSRCSGGV